MADPGQPRFLVLDANAFIADYWLRSPSFVLLRKFLKTAGTRLAVPRIVVEEVVNHYQEDLNRCRSELLQKAHQLERLVPSLAAPFIQVPGGKPLDGLAELRSDYASFLEGQLQQLGAKIPEYDDIPHSDIVKRDLARKRPFRPDGKGYRDALIWECVLRHCFEKDALTILVTQNVNDFCVKETTLHHDLTLDLLKQDFRVSNLELFRTLPEFTNRYIVPFLAENKEFVALVQAKKISGLDLRAVCEKHLDEIVTAINENPTSMILDPEIYQPQVDVVDTDCDVEVKDASELSDGVILVLFEACPNVSFTYFLPRDEFIAMSGERSKEIAVLDADWNESVMRVEETRPIRVDCRITFNLSSAEVKSFEVGRAEAASGVD